MAPTLVPGILQSVIKRYLNFSPSIPKEIGAVTNSGKGDNIKFL